jgi:N-acylneuraminate cytidylyltransferase/CMP-N,N'-diacetyllegionaminic acid synthase
MDALILARGGSKGVPKKNIKLLNNKPLISYVIESAKKSKKIKNIYVSTDCEEIKEVLKKLDVIVIDRPLEISQDNSLDVDSFRHFCNLLNYTSPIKIFNININTVTSLRSAHQMSESAYKFFIKDDNIWKPLVNGVDTNKPRQSYPKTYIPNGYVDIVNPNIFMNQDSFYGDKIFAFETKSTPEIDTMDDFDYIEYIIKYKKNV